jgi:hypothetical protein
MKPGKSTPLANSTIGIGKFDPSQSLLKIIEKELSSINDIYDNLSTKYDDLACDKLEKRFVQTRKMFKGTLMDLSNGHQPYINRSERRKEAVGNILKSSTGVAKIFHEARESKHFDRPVCTDAIENLIFDLKNLKHIIEVQGK